MSDPNKIRFFIFLSALLILIALEMFFSFHDSKKLKQTRWSANFTLSFLASFISRAIFPLGAVGVAIFAQKNNLGLLNYFSLNHLFIFTVLSLVALDFFIYIQHLVSHKLPIFWRLHRVHHSDINLDVTSALRFHPIEILVSLAYKALIILAFGFSVQSVLIFEILLNTFTMFNHANIYFPPKPERYLRLFIVTPQMHYIHHNERRQIHDTNYGFCLSIWDRVFRTYTDQCDMDRVGLNDYRSEEEQGFMSLLKQPFSR